MKSAVLEHELHSINASNIWKRNEFCFSLSTWIRDEKKIFPPQLSLDKSMNIIKKSDRYHHYEHPTTCINLFTCRLRFSIGERKRIFCNIGRFVWCSSNWEQYFASISSSPCFKSHLGIAFTVLLQPLSKVSYSDEFWMKRSSVWRNYDISCIVLLRPFSDVDTLMSVKQNDIRQEDLYFRFSLQYRITYYLIYTQGSNNLLSIFDNLSLILFINFRSLSGNLLSELTPRGFEGLDKLRILWVWHFESRLM